MTTKYMEDHLTLSLGPFERPSGTSQNAKRLFVPQKIKVKRVKRKKIQTIMSTPNYVGPTQMFEIL